MAKKKVVLVEDVRSFINAADRVKRFLEAFQKTDTVLPPETKLPHRKIAHEATLVADAGELLAILQRSISAEPRTWPEFTVAEVLAMRNRAEDVRGYVRAAGRALLAANVKLEMAVDQAAAKIVADVFAALAKEPLAALL